MSRRDEARRRYAAPAGCAVLAACLLMSIACGTPPRRPQATSPPLAGAGTPGDDGSGYLAELSREVLPTRAADQAAPQQSAEAGAGDSSGEYAGTRYGDHHFDWSQGPGLRSAGTRAYASGYQAVPANDLGEVGTISGRLTWPRPARLARAGNADGSLSPCRQAAALSAPHAVVYIERIQRGRSGVLSLGHAAQLGGMLRQRDCRLIPELQLASPAGSLLRVINEDREPHSLRVHRSEEEPWDLALPALATRELPLSEAGLMEVRSQSHDRSAWIVVAEHPYYTITGSDGRFRLEQVPPGTYTLVVVAARPRSREDAGVAMYRRTVVVRPRATADVAIQIPAR